MMIDRFLKLLVLSLIVTLVTACGIAEQNDSDKLHTNSQDFEVNEDIPKTEKSKRLGWDYEYIFLGFNDEQQNLLKMYLPQALAEQDGNFYKKNFGLTLSPAWWSDCGNYVGTLVEDPQSYKNLYGPEYFTVYKVPKSEPPKYLVSSSGEILGCPTFTNQKNVFETTHVLTFQKGWVHLSKDFQIIDHKKPERCKGREETLATITAKDKAYEVHWPNGIGDSQPFSEPVSIKSCLSNGYATLRIINENENQFLFTNWEKPIFDWPDELILQELENCESKKFCLLKKTSIPIYLLLDIFSPIEYGFYTHNSKFGDVTFLFLDQPKKTTTFITRSIDGLLIHAHFPFLDWEANAKDKTEIDEFFDDLFDIALYEIE